MMPDTWAASSSFVADETDPTAQFQGEEGDELEEVDVSAADDETEEVDVEDKEKPKKAAKKKANARPPVPEGYIAPVAFAKVLTKHLQEQGKLPEDEEIPPQMVYAYIKNTAKSKDPLPSYEAGGRSNLLKQDEALEWWARKDARVAERKANASKKKAKVVEGDVTEAEESENSSAEVAEAE